MIDHYPLTVILDLDPDKAAALPALLERIDDSLWNGDSAPLVAFDRVPAVHFARWVILPTHRDMLDEGTYPPLLAFTSSFADDADLGFKEACRRHLKDLLENAGTSFDGVFQCCAKYPATGTIDQKVDFLTRKPRLVAPGTFYTGSRWRTTERIREEQRVRTALDAAADAVLAGALPGDVAAMRLAVAGRVTAPTPLPTFPRPWPFEQLREAAIPLAIAVGVVLLAGLAAAGWAGTFWSHLGTLTRVLILPGSAAVVLLFAYLTLRAKETTDPELDYDKLPPGYLNEVSLVSQREDLGGVQNQLTHIVEIKPGLLRLLLLRSVLWLIDLLARKAFTRGDLGGIPSIHFAHWVIIDGGKRLLFFSNFDNSWESYLGEFVDRAANGLTAVWSNTRLFPRAKNVVQDGATDETRFKTWTRLLQIPTQVWYSAYPGISIRNVNDNTAICRGLSDPQAVPDRHWLRSL